MEQNYENQFKLVAVGVIAQIFFGLAIGGALLYNSFGPSGLWGPGLLDGDAFSLGRDLLWALSGALALFYILLKRGMGRISEDREMGVLKFWVRQLHRTGRSSAPALVLVLSSLGEATVILSFLISLFGGREGLFFLPGLLLGLGELALSFPRRPTMEKLVLLDRLAD